VKRTVVALRCGLLFGAGLIVSQLSNPAKVIGFLNVAGRWDPTLAFVMGGAVAVFGVLYRVALLRPTPVFGPRFVIPEAREIDAKLVAGAAIFGTGWGLGGFCPGPAIVSAGFGDSRVWAFVGAMVLGMIVVRLGRRRSDD
jgi:uncharacterized membrane protein YedE/YeeE